MTGRLQIKKLDDANKAGGKDAMKCTLMLIAGESSRALARAGRSVLDRDYYGIYPLQGTIINANDDPRSTMNSEMTNILKIIGLQLDMKSMKDFQSSLRYGQLMIMTNRDHDGTHTKGLLINFFHHYWPTLVREMSFLVDFITPIVKAMHHIEGVKSFNSMHEYESWKESLRGNATGWTIKYYKGLGTNTSKEAKKYFSDFHLHKKSFVWKDSQDGNAIEVAFGKTNNDKKARKEWLSNYVPGTHLDQKKPEKTYSDFVDKELIHSFIADLERAIPSMVDGLKTGQRKILFSALKRNLVNEAKVSQFAGYVSQHSGYHHGEQSLYDTIISMAHNFVGSNNVNLLQPIGQFGTRTLGGKDAAHAIHIFTKLSGATRVLFPKDDDVLLKYLNEDGQVIEPTWYLPVIPTVLVNGCEGIGTGWRTLIPNYNPREIVDNVRRLLNDESMLPMDPWYRGFKGTIEKTKSNEDGSSSYKITGLCEEVDATTVRIIELPVKKWTTDDYKNFLFTLSDIQEFRDLCDDNSVNFEVTFLEGKRPENKNLLEELKLTKTISTSNMCLFDQQGVIKKYATPEQILKEFFDIRLSYYEMRREIMLKNVETQLLKLEDKVNFICGVLCGDIIVFDREKADLVQELKHKGFTPFSVEYDHLLAMDISTMTQKKVQDLMTEIQEINKTQEDLSKVKAKSLWLKDLKSLDIELEKLDSEEDAESDTTKALNNELEKLDLEEDAQSDTAEALDIELEDAQAEKDRNASERVNKKLEKLNQYAAQKWKEKECTYKRFSDNQSRVLQEFSGTMASIKQDVLSTQKELCEFQTCCSSKLTELAYAIKDDHVVWEENRKLYNEVQDLRGNIRVYCRIRALLPLKIVKYIGENGELVVANPLKQGKETHRWFRFNKVFGQAATQEEVFQDTQPLIRSVLDGYNVCIVAYGQTGSGKTYTMSGPSSASEEDYGVNYRALNDLFILTQSKQKRVIYEVQVQMIEVYNEHVRDLLLPGGSSKSLDILSTALPDGRVVPEATMKSVTSTEDVAKVMGIGLNNRAVGATALNERSSRSHCVLSVHVRGVDVETSSVSQGTLNLVDLAGSERVSHSEVTGVRLQETTFINKSLSALGDVIHALGQHSSHVPYRNSKLTHLLQSSLGGKAKTLMFFHVKPDVDSYAESLNTLKFAERVSHVELGAAKSNKESRHVRELMDEVLNLKDVIAKKDEELQKLKNSSPRKGFQPSKCAGQPSKFASVKKKVDFDK